MQQEKKMKKSVLFTLVIVVTLTLLLFNTSCKDIKLELMWADVSGSGSYDSQSDQSTIEMEGWIRVVQPGIVETPVQSMLVDWAFALYEGNTLVLQVQKGQIASVLGDVTLNTSQVEFFWLWVYLTTTTPKSGDIFNGYKPDTMVFSVIVQDFEENIYQDQVAVPFKFTELK